MLKIDWAEGYYNSPHIVIEDALDLLPREDCEFTYTNNLWYHIQRNGLVRYLAHSGADSNEGGFGGASFTILHNGEPKVLKGPWSSRASYLNMFLPEDQQVADIVLDNGRGRMSCAMLVSKIVEMWDQDAYLVRWLSENDEEHGPVTASMEPNRLIKPSGLVFERNTKIQVFAEPVK